MNLELTEEQRAIQSVARDFADKEVRPIAEAIDREARFPAETVRRMGELGLMGLFIPEECGGSGADVVAYALAVEEMVARTSTQVAPWVIVEGNDKNFARIKILRTLADGLERRLQKRSSSDS